MLLEQQIKLLTAWYVAGDHVRERMREDRDRGEVTATTAMIVLLVAAAIAAGGIIATKSNSNANNVPEP